VGVDIRVVNITPDVVAKLGSKHGVSADQVIAACTNVISATWNTDHRGRRLYLRGYTEHRRELLVVLYPTAREGFWNVATARFC
jgi:hypothetical protein